MWNRERKFSAVLGAFLRPLLEYCIRLWALESPLKNPQTNWRGIKRELEVVEAWPVMVIGRFYSNRMTLQKEDWDALFCYEIIDRKFDCIPVLCQLKINNKLNLVWEKFEWGTWKSTQCENVQVLAKVIFCLWRDVRSWVLYLLIIFLKIRVVFLLKLI